MPDRVTVFPSPLTVIRVQVPSSGVFIVAGSGKAPALLALAAHPGKVSRNKNLKVHLLHGITCRACEAVRKGRAWSLKNIRIIRIMRSETGSRRGFCWQNGLLSALKQFA